MSDELPAFSGDRPKCAKCGWVGASTRLLLAHDDRHQAEWATRLDEARDTLAALTDPLTRAILDLHTEDDEHSCEGCDNDGWDEEPRIWPCLTVRGIARFYGIPLPGDP